MAYYMVQRTESGHWVNFCGLYRDWDNARATMERNAKSAVFDLLGNPVTFRIVEYHIVEDL